MFLLQCLSKVAVFCLLVALFACEAENSLESDRAEPTTAFAIEHLFIPEMAPGSHTGVAYLRIRNNTAKALFKTDHSSY